MKPSVSGYLARMAASPEESPLPVVLPIPIAARLRPHGNAAWEPDRHGSGGGEPRCAIAPERHPFIGIGGGPSGSNGDTTSSMSTATASPTLTTGADHIAT